MEVESSSVVDAFDVIVSGVTVGVIVSGVTVDVDDDLGISDDIVEDDAGTVVIGVSDTVVDVIVVVGGGELQSCIFPQIGFSVVDGVVVGVSGCLVVVVVVVDVIVVVLGVAIGVVVAVLAVVDVGFSVVGLEGQ